VLLLDVTPLSFGIETFGGVFTALIEKNTTIPTQKSQVFSTAADNQTSVEIHILQGERPMASDNKTLGKFMLDGIPPSPRGIPQIEVSLDIDANGILNVSAKDKATGKVQSVRIEASTQLSKEEIEQLKQEAAAHAEEDAKKRLLIEARNHAEQLVYTAEKSLKDAGDKVAEDMKQAVQEKIATVKSAQEGEDMEAIVAATEALSTELQKIGQSMYNQESAATEPSGETPHEGDTTTTDESH
jgi:molecular chaperone DnaK